jgi:hypothetical protein
VISLNVVGTGVDNRSCHAGLRWMIPSLLPLGKTATASVSVPTYYKVQDKKEKGGGGCLVRRRRWEHVFCVVSGILSP